MKLTIDHILSIVDELPKGISYDYVSGGDTKAKLISVDKDNNRIEIARVNADSSEKAASMTTDTLNILCKSISENIPFKFDNVLNGSGNVRSTMEAIFAHTSEFYSCKINRVKHLVWVPQIKHAIGEITDINVIEDEFKKLLVPGKAKESLPLQQIFYGAPGTGKSHGIDVETKGQKVIRTTFHPDSDYSTFVGAYKPVMREVPIMTVIGTKSVPVEDHYGKHVFEKKIEYDFIPQAFTEAYVEAWKDLQRPVFLVIEEINRGNCAQIFGDIFQLLDRDDNGFSSYMISPDEDLHRYLAEVLDKDEDSFDEVCPLDNSDIMEIGAGIKMCLPPNLHIWATMNTSDQSLFPIDSAFKRRWDWKFVKITEGVEKNDQGEIVFEKDENGDIKNDENGKPIKKKLGWQIKLSDEKTQDWWKFIQKVNEIIASMTSSADKQLGYFFCKPDLDKTTISAETFVSKVIFYLWNDVFKDFGFEDASLFRYKVNDKEEKDLTFPDFYDEDGEMVDTTRLTDFVDKVMNWKKTKEDND